MARSTILVVSCLLSICSGSLSPIAPRAFDPVPLGKVTPSGWIRAQLQAEFHGLAGNNWLGGGGRVNQSNWLGGKGYNGLAESYPYWLNGIVPLATLLGDDAKGMQAEVKAQFDYILDEAESSKNKGWLGPLVDGDPWSSFRFATCVNQYIEATGDARALKALWTFAGRLLAYLEKTPFPEGDWSQSRWQELVMAYQWLLDYGAANATKAQIGTVVDLMAIAKKQGFDWAGWLASDADHPFVNVTVPGKPNVVAWFPDNTEDADAIGDNKRMPHVNRQWTHGVNMGQATMTWGILYRMDGDKAWIEKGRQAWTKLYNLHGQANGVFSGDETLAGLPANRGSETCLVVEQMQSAAEMFHTTGDPWYADKLETIAYNALPAAFHNGSMWALNYFQQVNKLDAMDGQPKCESGCTYCFGMVYECCVSNHVQGWPKFVARQFATTKDGLLVSQYFPSTLNNISLKDGNSASVKVITEYPFAESVTFAIDAAAGFPFTMRIPAWCQNASLVLPNGETLGPLAVGLHTVPVAAGSSRLTLQLPMEIRVERRPAYRLTPNETVDTMAANIYRGPLLYALSRESTRDPKATYEEGASLLPAGQAHGENEYLLGTGSWTYALRISDDKAPGADMHFEQKSMPELPLGQGPFAETLAPGRITVKGQLLDGSAWDILHEGRGAAVKCNAGTTSIKDYTASNAANPPMSPMKGVTTKLQDLVLLPVGATNLRIAEFPTTVASSGVADGVAYV